VFATAGLYYITFDNVRIDLHVNSLRLSRDKKEKHFIFREEEIKVFGCQKTFCGSWDMTWPEVT